MDRDDLVERVAEAIWVARGGIARVWHELTDPRARGLSATDVAECRASARAAIAIIEPAVREECAKVLDDWKGVPARNSYRVTRKAYAAAIRAGAKP